MSKVKIVTSSKEQSKITSIGEIKFDADGVSIDSYDRASIERIIDASPSLSIEGEIKVIKKAPVDLGEEGLKIESTKSDTYTQEQVDKMLLDNAERLILKISESLGVDQSIIEASLMGPIPTEIPVHLEQKVEAQLEEITEGTTSESEEESEEIKAARESMKDMKIDELRDVLIKGGVEPSAWEDLKGNEGKKQMIELIINIAKVE